MIHSNSNVRYLLGIDAGGTKTDFVLTDLQFNPLESLTLGSANPIDIGIEEMKKVLTDGINAVCKNYDSSSVSLFAGMAGGITGNNKDLIYTFLSEFGFAYTANGSDIDNCLAMALGKQNGIVVIMGTGIAAFCRENEKLHRIGGWGYLLDKGGSGYHIGADALDCALRFTDGRGGSAYIKQAVEEKLQNSITNSIPAIYRGGKAFIASFAPIVFEAYKQKDAYARDILDRNVKEAAVLINTAYEKAEDKNIPTVICGGLSHETVTLLPFFKKYTSKNISFSTENPVNGALMLAKENIGSIESC